MNGYVCDETSYLIETIIKRIHDIYELGYKPAILIVSRSLYMRFMSDMEISRHLMFDAKSMCIKEFLGVRLHISPMLPDGGFMVLTAEDLDILYQYEEILRNKVFNIEAANVEFNIEGMTKEMISRKTNLLDGFGET